MSARRRSTLPLCLLAACLTALPAATTAISDGWAVVSNVDSIVDGVRHGAQAGRIPPLTGVTTADDCLDYCEELDTCTMATFFPVGTSEAGNCYLQDVSYREAAIVDASSTVAQGVQLLVRDTSCAALSPSLPTKATCVERAALAERQTPTEAALPKRSDTGLAKYDMRCPDGLAACSIGKFDGYECIDTMDELEQCGGCLGHGGVNCLDLPGVEGVACAAGVCDVISCRFGFVFDHESGSCVADL